MKEVISVKVAAARLNIDAETLRQGLRNGTFPVGCAIQSATGRYSRYTYIIPAVAFERFMTTGKYSIDEIMDAIKRLSKGAA